MARLENDVIFHRERLREILTYVTKGSTIMESRSQGDKMKSSVHSVAEGLADVREELQNRLGAAWETGREKVSACAQATDRTIREKPYQSIGIALGLGVLIGMILNRNRGGWRREDY
jgi:ElaB/YqjD/DUF883 family membrane-anchored ribosome-binding protein